LANQNKPNKEGKGTATAPVKTKKTLGEKGMGNLGDLSSFQGVNWKSREAGAEKKRLDEELRQPEGECKTRVSTRGKKNCIGSTLTW